MSSSIPPGWEKLDSAEWELSSRRVSIGPRWWSWQQHKCITSRPRWWSWEQHKCITSKPRWWKWNLLSWQTGGRFDESSSM